MQDKPVISLLLDTDIKIDDATAAIEENINGLSLPSGTDIEVVPFNLNETSAISYVVTNSSNDLNELEAIATTEIIPTIEQLPGVQRVDLLGSLDSNNEDIPTANSNTLIHFNGEKAIAFQVIKQADANTLEVVRQSLNKK